MNLAKDFATLVTSFPPGTRLKLEFWRYRDGFAQLQADLWRRAQANEAVATYVLGYLERNPEAGNPDHARAFGFFHRAAALGHVRAMEMVGFAYRAGRGTDKNLAEATKWYRRAAEAGSAGGMVSLGILIATGEAGAPDPAEAFRWFERSAAGGNAAAHYLMANYLDTGRGTARDRDAGAKHLIEAARGGSIDALTQFTSDTSKWRPSAEFISALQRRLAEAGAYHGPLDGRPSADVAAALSRLQSGRKP
jgi:TPR repeat protein